MDPYSDFAERFDLLVDWDRRRKREEPLFRRVLPENVRSVLDCHCGTGFHGVMLTEMGYTVEGVDCSAEMLKIARQNLEARGLDVRLHCCDVKEMLPALGRKFDCVISMGNSITHEQSDESLLKALCTMRETLTNNGICIIHMQDFDQLCRDQDRFIPSRFNHNAYGGETFIFAIDYFKDRVVFNIQSIIERNGKSAFHVDVVDYNPVGVKKMEGMMVKAGFRDILKYSDFRLNPHGAQETYDLIFVARGP